MVNLFGSAIRTVSGTNTPNSVPGGNRHLPMLNEVSASLQNYLYSNSQIKRKKSLMNWYKTVGELTGFINKVAKDIIGKYHFEPVVGGSSGRNKIQAAERFALETKYRSTKLSQVVDKLVTGEGFGWIKGFQKQDISKAAKEFLKKKGFGVQESKALSYFLTNQIEKKQAQDIYGDVGGIDEDVLRPRKFRYLPSSTVETIYDQYDIKEYVQNVGVNKIRFNVNEIIRSTYMDVDGKVKGFTPVESLLVQLELLRLMWLNMLAVHQNGGSPDKIIVLEDMKDVNSQAYKRIEQQLRNYKLVNNKHGNMLFTGKVGINDLNAIADMQFGDMGLYITGLLALQWGLPRSSIPFIQGGTNTKDDTGGNSEKGYWENIEYSQISEAEDDNTQLWIPYFGVKIVFDHSYIQKDVQRETMLTQKYNNLLTVDQLLFKNGKQLKEDKKLALLGLTSEDVETVKEGLDITGTPIQQLSNDERDDSEDKKNIKDKKKTEQESTTPIKSTGTGKERRDKLFLESKEVFTDVAERVDFATFIELYNEDKAYNPGKPPRIFKRTNDSFTTYRFKSSDFVYMTIVKTNELEGKRTLLMNLGTIYEV